MFVINKIKEKRKKKKLMNIQREIEKQKKINSNSKSYINYRKISPCENISLKKYAYKLPIRFCIFN